MLKSNEYCLLVIGLVYGAFLLSCIPLVENGGFKDVGVEIQSSRVLEEEDPGDTDSSATDEDSAELSEETPPPPPDKEFSGTSTPEGGPRPIIQDL